MQNNFDAWVADTNQILTQIQEAKFEDRLEIGLQLANQVLGLITDEQLREPEDVVSEHLVNPPNAERQDSWFFNHPWMEGALAAFDLFDGDSIPVQAKFYWLKKKSSAIVAGSVHFTRNWEDFDYTRNAQHKVGIDFFLDPTASTLTLVLSDRGKLRVLDLFGRLTNTHLEVFKTWAKVKSAAEQLTIHNCVWESFKLQSINSKFYFGVADAFTELVSHLVKLGKPEEESKLFASRLMGRLIFVWFLRKMELISDSQDYFNAESEDQGEYYRSKLEKLFFGVLNTPISERDSGDFINSDESTPYLNGGLFAPKFADWVADRNLTFPSFFFHRLFEHFHQFNFTTDESTTEYEQVAIDPEMLGRVFESLLATQIEETGVQARKAKGAFYTPREIVSYMCKESVRGYLYAKLEDSQAHQSSVDKLLDTSDQDWALNGTNSLADIPKNIRPEITQALIELKTFDPACGSGAFPIGLLQLLTKLRTRLSPSSERYALKMDILQRSIFGGDIEPMAAEIARLRSWLALIIEVRDRGVRVEPLPNLDFNFVVANSLIPLEDEGLFSDPTLQNRLADLRNKYFLASSKKSKDKIQNDYLKAIQSDLIDNQDDRALQLKSFNPFDSEQVADFFDSEYMFGIEEFDIVIGNPPYISALAAKKSLDPVTREKYKQLYSSASGAYDLYIIFLEFGLRQLTQTGVLAYITPTKFVSAKYAQAFREFAKSRLLAVADFTNQRIFESAGVSTLISLYSGSSTTRPVEVSRFKGEILDSKETIHFERSTLSEFPENLWGHLKWGEYKIVSDIYSRCFTLDEVSTVVASSTASEAEAYAKKVSNVPSPKAHKIINTGTISPYFCQWGEKPLSNRGSKLLTPYLESSAPNLRRAEMYAQSKLVIAKLAKRLVAMADIKGEYASTNTTFVIASDSNYSLLFLAGLLNSTLYQYIYATMFSGLNMLGSFQFQAPQTRLLPIPKDSSEGVRSSLEAKVREILDGGPSNPDALRLQAELDLIVYQIWGLGDEDMRIIESAMKSAISSQVGDITGEVGEIED